MAAVPPNDFSIKALMKPLDVEQKKHPASGLLSKVVETSSSALAKLTGTVYENSRGWETFNWTWNVFARTKHKEELEQKKPAFEFVCRLIYEKENDPEIKKSNLQSALRELDQMVGYLPAERYYLQAQAYEQLQEYAKAYQALQQSQSLDPLDSNDPLHIFNYTLNYKDARYEARKGKLAKEIEKISPEQRTIIDWEVLVEHYPNDPTLREGLILAYYKGEANTESTTAEGAAGTEGQEQASRKLTATEASKYQEIWRGLIAELLKKESRSPHEEAIVGLFLLRELNTDPQKPYAKSGDKEFEKAYDHLLKAANDKEADGGAHIADIAEAQYQVAKRVMNDSTSAFSKKALNARRDLQYLTSAADNGHPEAQYELGQHYLKSKEYRSAKKYLTDAVQQKHPQAKFALLMLEAETASKEDQPSLQYAIGMHYKEKVNKNQLAFPQKGADAEAAFQWFQKAHEGGNLQATCVLGDIYASRGDFDKASDLFDKVIKTQAEGLSRDIQIYARRRYTFCEQRAQNRDAVQDKSIWSDPFKARAV